MRVGELKARSAPQGHCELIDQRGAAAVVQVHLLARRLCGWHTNQVRSQAQEVHPWERGHVDALARHT